jgi:hypothetical protein
MDSCWPYRLAKLPPRIDTILYLLQEELKAAKHFNALANVGFNDSYDQPYLGPVILNYMGFEKRDDELIQFYTELIDEYADKLREDSDQMAEFVVEVFVEISIELKQRQEK